MRRKRSNNFSEEGAVMAKVYEAKLFEEEGLYG